MEEMNQAQIVIASPTSETDRFAATRFQYYWQKLTHQELPIMEQSSSPLQIWIGTPQTHSEIKDLVQSQNLGPDGIYMKSLRFPDQNRVLLLTGTPPRGSIYAVYEFFYQIMGVRWLDPETTHFPPNQPLFIPEVSHSYTPPLYYRDSNYWLFSRYPEFALAHRINGSLGGFDNPEMGGKIRYVSGFFCHTFFSFINPDEYFDSHPEYFSEVNGKRMKKSQLCLTHPEVQKIVIEKAREALRKAGKNEKYLSITQMDWPFWCESWPMKTIDEYEGSQSGSMVRFINEVARQLGPEFPDILFDTFGYTYTRKPPLHAIPEPNVLIRLCSIECDFSRRFTDPESPENQAFMRDLKGWSIAKNLHVWDYTQNFNNFQGPHPNVSIIQPNIKTLVEHGVKGLFEQSSPSPHSDFDNLKAYVIGRSMWEPDVDGAQLIDEFIRLYYQEAAPYIHEYLKLIHQKVLKDKYSLNTLNELDWLDYELVTAAQKIFQDAFSVITSSTVEQRLKYAHIPVQFAALICPPSVEIKEDRYIFKRPPSQTFDEYWQMIMDYGVTHIGDDPIDKLRLRLNGMNPPRHEEIPLLKLKNKYHEIWVVPSLGGAIQRWKEKTTGTELFKAYRKPFFNQIAWLEWVKMNPDSPLKEEPLKNQYKVLQSSNSHLILESTQDNGLILRREIRLNEDQPTVLIRLEIQNSTDHPVQPWIKPHPEFWTQGQKEPNLWIKQSGKWRKEIMDFVVADEVRAKLLSPEQIEAWAFHLDKTNVSLVNWIPRQNVETLMAFNNIRKEHINLETIPTSKPIEPGQTIVLENIYEVIKGKPRK